MGEMSEAPGGRGEVLVWWFLPGGLVLFVVVSVSPRIHSETGTSNRALVQSILYMEC